ncbi:chromate efflux transporter [Roseateles sp. BYS87W]|uniref:Chromate efflux transporter n=1 Tax=Pelomonas baiyunensis TaxID=3299026 RepID=A0ABW7H2U7_9BURK
MPPALPAAPPAPVSFAQALRFWLQLGFISFGGPAGQIALMHAELVERRRWISEARFLHALNYCMVLPGPEAQQLATYIGWLMHRTAGGLAAGLLFVLPSLVLLIGLSWVYLAWGHVAAVAGVFYGLKPAVAALVAQAAHRMGSRVLKNGWLWALAVGAFVAIAVLQWPFPAVVAAAALLGHLGGRWRPHAFSLKSGHSASAAAGHAPALIDDDTPTPPHARFSRSGWVRVAGLGVLLGGAVLGVLMLLPSPSTTLVDMARFFTQAALLTFGGAYAVLPYVFDGAVQQHQWLTAAQMMDGLALGESTPGPLIMVVAFVGYVGGWTHQVFGPQALALAGAAGACVATFFTFLPSFVFILAGGPFIESTHGKLGFTAPLTAITAAVVGVILHLALFFAGHVVCPHGWSAPPDLAATALGVAAGVALIRLRWGVLPVLGACAAAGWALQAAGVA